MLFILITAICWCVFYGYWLWKARETKDNIYIQGIADIVIARIWIIAVFYPSVLPSALRRMAGHQNTSAEYSFRHCG